MDNAHLFALLNAGPALAPGKLMLTLMLATWLIVAVPVGLGWARAPRRNGPICSRCCWRPRWCWPRSRRGCGPKPGPSPHILARNTSSVPMNLASCRART